MSLTDAQKREVDARFDKLKSDLNDGSLKREMMAEVAAEGRKWTARDEDEWNAAMVVIGHESPKEG